MGRETIPGSLAAEGTPLASWDVSQLPPCLQGGEVHHLFDVV